MSLKPVPQVFGVRRIVPCQGRFCESKSKCAHYYAPELIGRATLPRLCEPGREEPEPMGVIGQFLPLVKP